MVRVMLPWLPHLRGAGSSWEYESEADRIRIKLRNVRLHRDGELTAAIWVFTPEGRLLPYSGVINLASAQTRERLARFLEDRYPLGSWVKHLDAVYTELFARISEGEPAVEIVADGQPRAVAYVVRPLLPENEVSIIYGWGGVGKGWLALLLARAVVTGMEPPGLPVTVEKSGQVLYLDYETSEAELRRRWNLVCGAAGHKLVYRRCVRPIPEDIDFLTGLVEEANPALIIIDSAGLAAGGDLNSPDSPITLFQALRQLKRTILLIAHAPKNAFDATVFGSAFFTNLARNVWELRAETEPGTHELTLALVHRKSNVSALQPPIAFALYIGDTVEVRPTSVDLAPVARSTRQEVLEALKAGPLTTKALAEATGLPVSTVRPALRRLEAAGKVRRLQSGLWELVEKEAEDEVPF